MQRCFLNINFSIKNFDQDKKNKLKKDILSLLKYYSKEVPKLDILIKDESQFAGRVRVAEFLIKDVFSKISNSKKVFSFNGKNYSVRMDSQRYLMFRENLFCVCCGIKTTRAFLEYHPYDMVPHFNFYAEDGDELILMTKDHILARALGGEDRLSNYQTMCSVCNSLKSHSNITLQSLKSLREYYDLNRNKFSKKQFHYMLEQFKSSLKNKDKILKTKKRSKNNEVLIKNDLFCYKDKKNSFFAVNVLDFLNLTKYNKIGYIKKGTLLEVVLQYNNCVVCSLGTNDTIKIKKQDTF